MHLILTGATGLVGSAVLNFIQHQAIPSGAVSRLSILTRRSVPILDTNSSKIQVINHTDFASYPPELLAQLKGATGCIWAIGVQQSAVSQDEYVDITVNYAVEAAKAFATLAPRFNLVYVSSDSATQTPGLMTLFMARIKGQAEMALLALSSSPDMASLRVYSVRPGGVDPNGDEVALDVFRNHRTRGYSAIMEKVLFPVFRTIHPGGVTPTKGLGRLLTSLASGDGEPLEGDDVLEEGRIIPNKAILRIIAAYDESTVASTEWVSHADL